MTFLAHILPTDWSVALAIFALGIGFGLNLFRKKYQPLKERSKNV